MSPGGPQAWSWGSPGGRAGLRPPLLTPQAICCPDHVHCCPQGHTCDPVAGSCLQEGGGRRPWVQKTPALARGGNVRCDEETSCPDGNTCCRLSSGAWGCCPLEQVWGGPAHGDKGSPYGDKDMLGSPVRWGSWGGAPRGAGGPGLGLRPGGARGVLGGGDVAQGTASGWSSVPGEMGTFRRALPPPVPWDRPSPARWNGVGVPCALGGTKADVPCPPGGTRANVPCASGGKCPAQGSHPPDVPWGWG